MILPPRPRHRSPSATPRSFPKNSSPFRSTTRYSASEVKRKKMKFAQLSPMTASSSMNRLMRRRERHRCATGVLDTSWPTCTSDSSTVHKTSYSPSAPSTQTRQLRSARCMKLPRTSGRRSLSLVSLATSIRFAYLTDGTSM